MTAYTIGIDLGTTGTKTVLFHPARGVVAQASSSVVLHSPGPGIAEADPAQWLANAEDGIRSVMSDAGISGRDVAAVSATGMVPAVVAVDATGAAIGNGILQNDARAVEEIRELEARLAPHHPVAVTGSAVTQQSVAPTALWLSRNRPRDWQRTAFLVGSYDWLLLALGADPHVERNWALESGLFRIDGASFAPALTAAGLDPDRIPPVRDSGDIVGGVAPDVAERTGLRAGTPLVVGGADHVLSAYAAGVTEHGDWLIKLGGAGDILAASDRVVADPRLYLDRHPVPDRWLPNGCMATSGSLIRWVQELTGGHPLDRMDAEAEERGPAAILCLPYFLGEKSPLHDPDLRGAFVGLELATSRGDLHRSVLEAIAYGFRHHAEVLEELGLGAERVMVTNGGSKSTLWKQILADVLDVGLAPVIDHPGGSLGAALAAAVGTGRVDGWGVATRLLRRGEPVRPVAGHRARYDDAYARWRELGGVLAPVSHGLARRG